MSEPTRPDVAAPPSARRGWVRAWLIAVATLLVVTALVAGAFIAWASSQSALDFVAREIALRSGGAVAIDGVRGSLWSTVQARTLTYRSDGLTVSAEDVALEWTPSALWSRMLAIRGLGARRITITLPPASGPTRLPSSLALPFDVAIRHAAVGEVVLVDGEARRTLQGVALGYHGSARAHVVHDAKLTLDGGRLEGYARIGADAPFPLDGAVGFAGNATWHGLSARVRVGGTLEALDLALIANAAGASAEGTARVTPFAATALPQASVKVRTLDLAAWWPGVPHTDLGGTITVALAADGGVSGTVDATNAASGPVDRDRLPLTALTGRYAYADGALELTELAGEAGPRARVRGSARIPLAEAGSFGSWRLTLTRIDLAAIHSALVATNLSGRFDAVLSAAGQDVTADLAQDNLGLAFTARVRGDAFDVTRLSARAGAGEFAGRARFNLAGARPFSVEGKATRLDPSQLGRFPPARLDGEVRASGTLEPTWVADVAVTLAPTSRFRDAPVYGSAQGRVLREAGSAAAAGRPAREAGAFGGFALQDARVDVQLAGAKLRAEGTYGASSGKLSADVDVPDLARVAKVLGEWAPAALAPVQGRVRGKATLAGPRDDLVARFEVHGEGLQREGIAVGALDVRGDVGARSAGGRFTLTARAAKLDTPAGSYASASAKLDGTPAAHTIALALVGQDIDATLRAEGGIAERRWTGKVASLANRGAYPVTLVAPARLELGAGLVALDDARVAIAEGKVRIATLRVVDGRLSTTGSFDAVPVAALAQLAGAPLPMRSTLTLAGEWDVVAAPTLSGTLAVRRQDGDLYAGRNNATDERGEIALGVSQLDVKAKLADDALTATLDAAATRVGTIRGKLAVGRGAGGEPGRFAADAPLEGSVVASLASLAPLQPFIGTLARVNGRVDADLQFRGTLGAAKFSGKLAGSDLRMDVPVYGLHWTDGVLRATLADGRLLLDEFSFRAGDGKFAASGVIAAAHDGEAADAKARAGAGTRLTWRADRLRATNRPDLRLVVSGNGELAFVERHLAVTGSLKVDEGRVDVETAAPGTTLGDDVIIVGRPRPPATSAKRFGAVPFGVDLALDLGSALQITGDGLQARLGGRVQVTAEPDGVLRAKGTIRTVNGSYYAFGQRLNIERGRLIFDGPIDNPALDIVALRKNLQVEAGVKVTGTARVPRVELTSEPPVPDGEKLSWLVLGQGLDQTTTGADTAALQAAAAALFTGGRMPLGTTLAQSIGLDDIAVRGSGSLAAGGSGTTGASGQVIAVGKRLSDRLYIVYEQGLSVAQNALRIEYALTRNITIRAEAGLVSGVGIYYRKSFN